MYSTVANSGPWLNLVAAIDHGDLRISALAQFAAECSPSVASHTLGETQSHKARSK